MSITVRTQWLTFMITVCIFLISGCASSFNPRPPDEVGFKQRAQVRSEGDVRVTAAVLSAEECELKFGSNLYRREIQPVWLEIENKGVEPVWFLPLGLDRAYFTPLESAFLSRFAIRRADHDEVDAYYVKSGMRNYVAPGTAVSGFVYTNLDEGTKAFNVDRGSTQSRGNR